LKAAKVTVHSDPMSAELVRAVLLEAGLHPMPIREAGHVTLPGSGPGYFVFVPEEELEAAVKMIKKSSYAQFLW
jgi:hypothetical protein